MSKVAHYLQEHLVGEVMTSTDARRYFATDGSIFQLAPALIAYPKNENDVRKTARFCWQLAERGRVIPLTPRGLGTDQTGAALGRGIMLVFPAHMNRILELDSKANTVTVEAGINFGKLQQTMQTHGRFVPSFPTSLEYSTVGGAVANNASGEKSVKYGDMRDYVKSLRVVLANGEVIETGRLSKRELNKKLGLATFEGEIYRSIDTLLEEQQNLVQRFEHNAPRNNAGYSLTDVKRKDGSFDLTPLIVGSQGTLAIITEATLATEPHNPQTSLIMGQFDSLANTQNAILELRGLSDMPSAIELINDAALRQVNELNPNQLKEVLPAPYPAIVLLAEFDDNERHQKKALKKAEKIFDKYAMSYQSTSEPEQQQLLWKLRHSSSVLIGHNDGLRRSVPLGDASVPLERLHEYLKGTASILKATNLTPAIWGHAGDGNLTFMPTLNIGQVGDRQRAFRVIDEYMRLVISLGGSISALEGDGRLRTPYLEAMYGPELYALLGKVKNIFDPYGNLNPGVKFGTTLDDLKELIRPEFSLAHIYDHLPRS